VEVCQFFVQRKWNFKNLTSMSRQVFHIEFRFVNFINPKLKPGKLSQEEIVKLFECYNEYGPQWSFFETKIKGR